MFGFLKKIVLAPIHGVGKGVDTLESAVLWQFVLLLIRHALTAVGAGNAVSGDEVHQIVGVVMTLVGLGWSAYRKIQAARQPAK